MKESLLKDIFAWAQVIAIIFVAFFIAFERLRRWSNRRNGKEQEAPINTGTNGSLKRIEKGLKSLTQSVSGIHKRIDDGVIEMAKVQTAMKEQKEQCGKTVNRFDEAITNQQKALLDIAMEK